MIRKALFLAAVIGMIGSIKVYAADPPAYEIGAIFAMSGSSSWYGKVMSHGAEQAIDEINAKGGIDGVPLKLIIEDHKGGGGAEGAAAMNRLLSLHPGIKAVLVSFGSPTLAVLPIANQKHILLLNGGSVSSALLGISKYLFNDRSLSSDTAKQAVQVAQTLAAGKKLAQLYWKNDVGDSIVRVVTPLWEKMGGTLVSSEAVPSDAPNMDTQMAKIRLSNPDVVGLWVFAPQVGVALKNIRAFGIKQPVVGLEFTAADAQVAGEAAQGYEYVTDYFQPTAASPWSKQFADSYKKRYDEDPEFFAANYYEDVYIISELIKRAKAKDAADYWDGENLRQALIANPKFESVYGGSLTFQENGVAQKRVALFRVDNGVGKFVKFLNPE